MPAATQAKGLAPEEPARRTVEVEAFCSWSGVQRKDDVERARQHRVGLVILARHAEHHVHEVRGVIEVVPGIHERQAGGVAIGQRDDGRQLSDDAMETDIPVLNTGVVHAMMVECRQRARHADDDRHGMRVAPETVVETGQLVMHQGVMTDDVFKLVFLRRIRQFAVAQQVGDFQEVALFGQLLDGITAIQQFTLVAVNESNGGLTTGRRQETGIIGEISGLTTQGTDIDHIIPMRTFQYREISRFAVDGQACFAFFAHGVLLLVLLMPLVGSETQTLPIFCMKHRDRRGTLLLQYWFSCATIFFQRTTSQGLLPLMNAHRS